VADDIDACYLVIVTLVRSTFRGRKSCVLSRGVVFACISAWPLLQHVLDLLVPLLGSYTV